MHLRPLQPRSLAIACLAIFTAWITWQAKKLEIASIPGNSNALLSKPAPDFQLSSIDGRTVALGDFHGKKNVVLIFWASWCGPCRLELPALVSFYQRTHKPDSGYEILAISIDEFRESAQGAAAGMKLSFPVLMDDGQKAAGAYGVWSIPSLFVIDKSGKVIYSDVGFDFGLEFALAGHLGIDPKLLTERSGGGNTVN
jgi:peroxiredoxin